MRKRKSKPKAPGSVGRRVTFSGAATLREAAALRDKLRTELARHSTLDLDCTALAEVDLSFVQLVLAARRSAAAAGKTLRLAGAPSPALHDVLVRGGFLAADGDAVNEQTSFWLKGVPQ